MDPGRPANSREAGETASHPRPPVSSSKLISKSFVRTRLRETTGAKEVSDAAVEAAVRDLEARFAQTLHRAQCRYQDEMEARRIHGVYPRGIVRPDHVVPIGRGNSPAATMKSTVGVGLDGLVKRAVQEVDDEKDAPEVG